MYGRVKCPTCLATIEISLAETLKDGKCPACKDHIAQKLEDLGVRVGITTATASGPKMQPIGKNLTQKVY